MDLLDRYLANVGYLLPFSERTEILAELRDILMSKMEDKEAELGRPLTELEREVVIQNFGHPFVVAGRYRKDKEVIGETFYPFWLMVMQIGAAVAVISAVILGLLHGFQRGNIGAGISWGISHGIGEFVSLTGVVTLVFLYLERTGQGQDLLNRWRPSQLPVISFEKLQAKRTNRFERAFEVVAGLVGLLFWTGLAPMPTDYAAGPGQTVHLAAGALWPSFYWLVVAIIAARVLGNVLDLFQLGAAAARRGYRIAVALATGGVLLLILGQAAQFGAPAAAFSRDALTQGPFMHIAGLSGPGLSAANYGANLGIAIALGWGVVGSVIEAGISIFKLVRLRRN